MVEHFSSHLAGAAYNFRRWPLAGRSRVFLLPSVYFLNGRNNKRSQPPPHRAAAVPRHDRLTALSGYLHLRNTYICIYLQSCAYIYVRACTRGLPRARVLGDNAAREQPHRSRGIRPIRSRVTIRSRSNTFGSLRGRCTFFFSENRRLIIFQFKYSDFSCLK